MLSKFVRSPSALVGVGWIVKVIVCVPASRRQAARLEQAGCLGSFASFPATEESFDKASKGALSNITSSSMQHNFETTIKDSLEARNDITTGVLMCVVFTFFTSQVFFGSWHTKGFSLNWFTEGWSWYKTFMSILLMSIVTASFYRLLNRKAQVKVWSEGIWTKKSGLVKWSDIKAFRTTSKVLRYAGITYRIYFLPRKQEDLSQEIVIEYYQLDKDFSELRNLIAYYATINNFVDSGNEKLPSG